MPRRTALIVPVPEAEPLVGELRLRLDPTAAAGVPAHVTVLFPFAPPELVDVDALAQLVGCFPAFDFVLDRVEHWDDGPVWLRPRPSRPFVDLTAAVWQRWPQFPPYEGVHDEVVPHLTISMTPIDVDLPLPIASRARNVLLLEEHEADGSWQTRLSLPLADHGVA